MNPVTMRFLALGLVVCVLSPLDALAHELRPALLELVPSQGSTTLATLSWSPVRANASPRLITSERCPADLVTQTAHRSTWRLPCDIDLALAESRLDLNVFIPDAVVRIHRGDHVTTHTLSRDHTRLGTSAAATANHGFLALGVEHILGGIDHLLFVLGLLLILLPRSGGNPPLRRLLLAVTSFTIAHSLTLALSVLELVQLPQGGVEAAIAASLVLLGLEVMNDEDTLTRRHPHVVALVFGLLHGFGFAGALRAIGLPEEDLAMALFSFNLGVELGQIAFVLVCLVILHGARRWAARVPWVTAGAYMVGGLGMFWLLERGLPLFSGVLS